MAVGPFTHTWNGRPGRAEGTLDPSGLCETMRWVRGGVRAWRPHRTRLLEACARLGWVAPELDTVASDANALAELWAMPPEEARVRLVLVPRRPNEAPDRLVQLQPLGDDLRQRRAGVDAALVLGPVTPEPALKQVPNGGARAAALRCAPCEPLLQDKDGHLLEGATWNLFVLMTDGTLSTPPLDGRILPGVTRAAVLARAHALGVSTSERAIRLPDLWAAREVFVTNALLPVARLCSLDGQRLPTETCLQSELLRDLDALDLA